MISMRSHVVTVAAVTAVIALIVSSVAVYVLMTADLYEEFDETLTARTTALAALVRIDNTAPDHVRIDLADVGEVITPGLAFQLWTSDGVLLAGDQDLMSFYEATRDLGVLPGAKRIFAMSIDGQTSARCLVRRCHPQSDNAQIFQDKTLVAVMMAPIVDIEHRLNQLSYLLIAVTLVTTCLSAAIQTWALRRGLQPLSILAEEISRLNKDDLNTRFDVMNRPQEIEPVIIRLNDMLSRLEESFAHERRFSAAAAHELRTPLAGLRATIEVGLMDLSVDEATKKRSSICLDVINHMQRLVDSLLFLARMDAGSVVANKQPIQLSSLIIEAWSAVENRAHERQLQCIFGVPDHMTVCTDHGLLRMVLSNLFENAVAHANDGGVVQVAVRDQGGQIICEVKNTGSRVAEADARRVCDRFWRGDQARSGHEHHLGLGLALCQDVMAVLGGSIEVTTEVGAEFVVRVFLPE